jgi:transposase
VPDLKKLAERLDAFENELTQVKQSLRSAEQARDQYHQLYLETLERCRKLERGLLGQKSERTPHDESQLSLGMLGLLLNKAAEQPEGSETTPVKPHERQRPTGRKPLPETLPRVDIYVLPDDVQRRGLDAYTKIGEDVSEVLERRSASMVVARIIKPKFVLKGSGDATTVLQASTPQLPIERGLAGPGMLADTLVKRWDDHLPLNRLERVYARDGIELNRSTICGWHTQLMPLFKPLIDAMRFDAFEQPYICTDATGVLVQAKEKCRTGHFWVIVAPGRHVLFEFSKKHDGDAVDKLLAGYEGYLVADAHVVYDHLYSDGTVKEVNCWAHVRRYFFKAYTSDKERATVGLAMINALFRIERTIANAPRKKKEKVRAAQSAPIVERFFSWCQAEKDNTLDDTPIRDGIRYSLNQREGLHRFLSDGRLPLHNNSSELNLRRQAVGRKNWLFIGSDDGAEANAVFVSLLASCRMHNVEPWAYLRDLCCLLPTWPSHRLLELSPLNWAVSSESEEVRRILALDPYRALTLGR